MKILISGICGFVGSTLAKAWLAAEEGLTLYGIDNLSRPGSEYNRYALQRLGVKLVHGDLRLPSDLAELPAVDWVVDAAANPSVTAGVYGQGSSRQLLEHNLFGTVNLLEYCKRHRAGLVLLSSSRVYAHAALCALPVQPAGRRFELDVTAQLPAGVGTAGIDERFSTAPPLSLYGSSKLASEVLTLEYGAAFDFPVWINRCGLLAGAGQFGRADQGVVAYWIHAWSRRQSLACFGFGGQGLQVRDLLHPFDLLPLLRRQVGNGSCAGPRLFNVGGGRAGSFSLAELSRWCAARFGPHLVAAEPGTRRYDVPWLILDSALAGAIWGWRPAIALETIFEELACHADAHPEWLEQTSLP